jgi:putative oxidoreductase
MDTLIGRLLISALFIVSGIWKITHFSTTAAYMVRVGMPVGEAAAVLAIGWRLKWIAWFMAAFVLVATGLAHRFWEVDPARFFGEMNNFLKNLAIIGGLLILAARGKA